MFLSLLAFLKVECSCGDQPLPLVSRVVGAVHHGEGRDEQHLQLRQHGGGPGDPHTGEHRQHRQHG